MRKLHVTVALMFTIALASCGHTNNLAKYNIKGSSATYRSSVAAGAMKSSAAVDPGSPSAVTSIAASIGSDAASKAAEEKIIHSISPDSLAAAFAAGIVHSTHDYLQLRTSGDVNGNATGNYIIESVLEEFSVNSSSTGVTATVRGTSRIIDRVTGAIVWEDEETNTVPLRSTPTTGHPVSDALASAFNAAQLADLSEAEIHNVLASSADEAGRQLAETLREDVAKLK